MTFLTYSFQQHEPSTLSIGHHLCTLNQYEMEKELCKATRTLPDKMIDTWLGDHTPYLQQESEGA